MLTLKEWHAKLTESDAFREARGAAIAEILKPDLLLGGYEPTSISWFQRLRNRIGRPFIDLGVKIMGEYAPYID